MFNNIGNKIKTYAEVVSWIGIIASVFTGIVIMTTSAEFVLGLLICIIGSLLFWISSFFLYGFGQLIENTDILVGKLAPDYKETSETQIEDEIREKQEYEYTTWEDRISVLSTEELNERINSEDWQDDYKALCKKELENRKRR